MLSLCDVVVFFFKQKTAYEMRISDWSSDVCSSDLTVHGQYAPQHLGLAGDGERIPERGQYALFAFIEPYLRFAQGGVVHRAQLRHEFVEHLPSALHPFQKHGRVVGDEDRKSTRLNSSH